MVYMLFCLTVAVLSVIAGWLVGQLWAEAGIIVAVALAAGGGWLLGDFIDEVKRAKSLGYHDEWLSE